MTNSDRYIVGLAATELREVQKHRRKSSDHLPRSAQHFGCFTCATIGQKIRTVVTFNDSQAGLGERDEEIFKQIGHVRGIRLVGVGQLSADEGISPDNFRILLVRLQCEVS